MHCTNLVVVGLVSLVCTIATTQAKGKPALAQRLYTTKQGACTAVCKDNLMEDCDVTCAPTPTRGPQAPAGLHKRGVVTVTNNGCTAVCWDLSPGTECDVHCSGGFATTLAPTPTSIAITSTVTSTTTASRKTFSEDGCTAVCWDMQPAGTECDLQCKESLPTKMPVFNKIVRTANLEAREDIQARQAHEARLARKFGLEARDVTVTITSIPEYCTASPELLSTTMVPVQGPQPFIAAQPSAIGSQASAAISLLQAGTTLPPAASSALSEASAFLFSISQAAATSANLPPISANATSVATATVGSTGITPSSLTTGNGSISSNSPETMITTGTGSISSTLSETITTTSSVESPSESAVSTPTQVTGAAPEGTVSNGLLLALIMVVAGNAFLMI